MFDIGSDSGQFPQRLELSSGRVISRGVTLSLLSSIFPEQAAGTAVPAAALRYACFTKCFANRRRRPGI